MHVETPQNVIPMSVEQCGGSAPIAPFSIVVTSYNRETWIKSTLESALAQTAPATEIIVVDDGSSDGTLDVIRSCGPKVKLIAIDNDGTGQTRPLNIGIRESRSEYVILLDSDDRFDPHLVQRYQQAFVDHPSAGLASSNWQVECYEDGRLVETALNEPNVIRQYSSQSQRGDVLHIPQRDAFRLLCQGNFLRSCTGTAFPKRVWEELGGFDESIRTSTDCNLFFRVLRKHSLLYLDQPLRIMSRHQQNVSRAALSGKARPDLIENHLKILQRELALGGSGEEIRWLADAYAGWLLDLAYCYKQCGRYRDAFHSFARCLGRGRRIVPALRGLLGLSWRGWGSTSRGSHDVHTTDAARK